MYACMYVFMNVYMYVEYIGMSKQNESILYQFKFCILILMLIKVYFLWFK